MSKQDLTRYGLIITLGVIDMRLLASTIISPLLNDNSWFISYLILCMTAFALQSKTVSLGPGGSFSPVPLLVYIASIMLGPWAILPIALIIWWRPGRPLYSKVFNVLQYVIHAGLSAQVFWTIYRIPHDGSILFVIASIISIVVFIGINLLLVTVSKVLNGEAPAGTLWRMYYRPILPLYFDNLIHGAVSLLICIKIGPEGIIIAVVIAASKLYAQHRLVTGALGKTISVESLIQIIDARDKYTKDHSERVARYAKGIAEAMHLSRSKIADLELAGRLHDIGKIAVPDHILLGERTLSPEEFDRVKEHPLRSQQILSAIPELSAVANIVLQHHERFDGTGYPNRLSSGEICLEARILACADAFDAMTTDRPYRRALSISDAVDQLVANNGTQFDPSVVNAFIRVLDAHGTNQLTALVNRPLRDSFAHRW